MTPVSSSSTSAQPSISPQNDSLKELSAKVTANANSKINFTPKKTCEVPCEFKDNMENRCLTLIPSDNRAFKCGYCEIFYCSTHRNPARMHTCPKDKTEEKKQAWKNRPIENHQTCSIPWRGLEPDSNGGIGF